MNANRDAGRSNGERRKDYAHALLAAQRALYVLRGRRALLSALLCSGTASADDVRDAVELPAGLSPKFFGVVPGPLAIARIIRRVGFTSTSRPTAHARPVSVWELVDAAKATAWLDEHPDPGDPPAAVQQSLWPGGPPENGTGPTAATVEPVTGGEA